MAKLSLLCHPVGVSKNSTRQVLLNLELLYEYLNDRKKNMPICQLSQTNNKQTNDISRSGILHIK